MVRGKESGAGMGEQCEDKRVVGELVRGVRIEVYGVRGGVGSAGQGAECKV